MAMTREQILIEQPHWDAATDHATIETRGENVYTPLGSGSDRYTVWQVRSVDDGTALDTARVVLQAAAVRCRTGCYFYCKQSDTKVHRLTGATDEDDQFAWSAAWSIGSSNGQWRRATTTTAGRTLTLNIPANTERVYLLFLPNSDGDTVTITQSGGTLVDGSLNTALGGDFGSVTNLTLYKKFALVARDFGGGGGTVTISPDVGGGTKYTIFIGAICVGTGASNPNDGVWDPASWTDVLTYGQSAPGPLYMTVNGSTQYYGIGGGHFSGNRCVVSPTEVIDYQSAGVRTAWAPATDTWVRTLADAYHVRLTGEMSWDATYTEIGPWAHDIIITPSGCQHVTEVTWDEDAVTAGAVTASSGGYCAQWGTAAAFTSFRMLPFDVNTQALPGVSGWDGGNFTSRDVERIDLYGYDAYGGELSATLTGGVLISGLATPVVAAGAKAFVTRRAEGWAKPYINMLPAVVTIENDTRLLYWMRREVGDLPPDLVGVLNV
jgi:hypothetical protein